MLGIGIVRVLNSNEFPISYLPIINRRNRDLCAEQPRKYQTCNTEVTYHTMFFLFTSGLITLIFFIKGKSLIR